MAKYRVVSQRGAGMGGPRPWECVVEVGDDAPPPANGERVHGNTAPYDWRPVETEPDASVALDLKLQADLDRAAGVAPPE